MHPSPQNFTDLHRAFGMTRWKLEFMRWAEREQLHAWYMPKRPQDWAVAQQASRMADHIARTPEFKERWVRACEDAIMQNVSARPPPLDAWLAVPPPR